MEKNIIKLNEKQFKKLVENINHNSNEEIENASFDKKTNEFIITSLFNGDSRREYRTRLNDKIIDAVFMEEKIR